MKQKRLCKVKRCAVPHSSLGYCGKHYMRFRRYGDHNYITPEKERRIRSREARPNLGKAKSTTYLKLLGRHAHRVIMESHLGRKLTRKEVVHHIDGNRHNNSIDNLELLTQSEHASLHHPEANKKRNEAIKKRGGHYK